VNISFGSKVSTQGKLSPQQKIVIVAFDVRIVFFTIIVTSSRAEAYMEVSCDLYWTHDLSPVDTPLELVSWSRWMESRRLPESFAPPFLRFCQIARYPPSRILSKAQIVTEDPGDSYSACHQWSC
jgi:hypothetical protein